MGQLDYATRQDLILQVSQERHSQIHSLRLIAASAIAAAGQVRDTRLDRLEHPAPPPEPDIWFDLLLDVALSAGVSAVAGTIVKRLTKRFVASRVAANLLVGPDGRTPSGVMVVGEFRQVLAKAQKDSETAIASRRELWEDLINGYANGVVSGGYKAAQTRVSASDKSQPSGPTRGRATPTMQPELDSPASVIEEAVLRGVAKQEHAVGVTLDRYLALINDPTLTPNHADAFEQFLRQLAATPRADDLDARKLRLFFEMCIWAMMFPFIAQNVKVRNSWYIPPFVDESGVRIVPVPERFAYSYHPQLTIREELASYLVRRIPHPASADGVRSIADHISDLEKSSKGSPNGGKSSRAASYLAALPKDWLDQKGQPLESPIFVPSKAYGELDRCFRRLVKETDEVLGRLEKLQSAAYRTRTYGPPPPVGYGR